MLNVTSLLEFSRAHCVAICAILVPVNLLTTLRTIIFVGVDRPASQLRQAAGLASFSAIVMVLHVMTWFVAGVVMAPTYILFVMAGVCLSVNLWAVLHTWSMQRLLRKLRHSLELLQTQISSPS